MYGWEIRGALADHFRESITDEDVARAIDRAKRALVPIASARSRSRRSVRGDVPSPRRPPPGRRPSSARATPASPRETFWTPRRPASPRSRAATTTPPPFAEAAERLASSTPLTRAPLVAALHSNRSAALLRAGRPADALRSGRRRGRRRDVAERTFAAARRSSRREPSPKPPPRTRAPFATPTPTPTPIPPRILARPRNRNRRATPSW